ncbi:MAG: YdcF family protein [Patescibacteria group bacterium]
MKSEDPIVAAFVPSYCLVADQSGLSTLSKESVEGSARLYRSRLVNRIILSTAYNVWETEWQMKLELLKSLGVPTEHIFCIKEVTSSYDEVQGLRQYIEELGFVKCFLVTERCHTPRAYMALQAEFPQLGIVCETFDVTELEETYEPHHIKILGKIKGWRTQYYWSWWLWNKSFELITPILLRKKLKQNRLAQASA